MSPTNKVKCSAIEPFVIGCTDKLLKRNAVFDVLNGRLNNNDIVRVLNSYVNKRNIGCESAERGNQEESFDEDTIKICDVQLLKKPLGNLLHKFNVKRKVEKQTLSELDSINTINKNLDHNVTDLFTDQLIAKRVNALRYRESVFRAASKLNREMPPFPYWSYKDSSKKVIQTKKINVGGRIFEILQETYNNIQNTKLFNCIQGDSYNDIVFIDRDPVCFNAVLNFYRTGRLHIPSNICLTFFEEELIFWGANEEFLEPCCWTDYQTCKTASYKLKRYSEDRDKTQFANSGYCCNFKYRETLYGILTTNSNLLFSRWMSLVCTIMIIGAICCLILETSPGGRNNRGTDTTAEYSINESVTNFVKRTEISANIRILEILISGYFFFEFIFRLILCPNKFEFFSDALNWVDIISTFTSIIGSTKIVTDDTGYLAEYILLLKSTRVLRLFRITKDIRSGIGAVVLTIKACFSELTLVFVILFVATIMFGVLIFSAEFTDPSVNIYSVFIGMWWSIVSMSGVGYGDFYPKTQLGYLVGAICIMVGVIICQMPVPIFLKNFSIYYNQASARLISQSHLLLYENVDKKEVLKIEDDILRRESNKMKEKKNGFVHILSKIH